ncbi:myeloid cell surface antigen CD33-like [Mobula hypostoma]|uniref:myeloid cell surface antigen CD33-like n=1 Tax=Mobula hypostoma TaxID=723540 RepID=UPI002FC2AD3D
MIGRFYLLLSLLQAVVSEEWRADIPTEVTAQRGLCARIPCHYRYPSSLENKQRTGVWFNKKGATKSIVFHSRDHAFESSRFQLKTQLTGNLSDGDCSLLINNIKQEDEGSYFFRIEFKSSSNYNYPDIQLHVSDFTDKPSIFATEMVAGKPMNISCTFNTTCEKMSPILTWVMPTNVPASNSSSVTQWGDTLMYTSVLTLTPEPKHHGQSLTCRVRYLSVSSEQTLTLTLWLVGPVIPLAVTAAIVFLIITSAVIFFICKTRQRTNRPPEGALRQTSVKGSGKVPITKNQKEKEHCRRYHARSGKQVTNARKAQKNLETALDHQRIEYQTENIYENCLFDESIYANI